jgi:hypothetical protein
MPKFIYESPNIDHKISDEKGKVIAAFKPDPEPKPAEGIYPVRGVFVTEDEKIAKVLDGLEAHGIKKAAGSDAVKADPAKTSDPEKK